MARERGCSIEPHGSGLVDSAPRPVSLLPAAPAHHNPQTCCISFCCDSLLQPYPWRRCACQLHLLIMMPNRMH